MILFRVCVAVFVFTASVESRAADRPNIIIFMTDDMGFSDLGCYGSEIETPNLDALAMGGVRFTQFYNTARCCPTRASLLTGLYAHQAGVGGMTKDEGPSRPGYRGRLMENCVTIAEVLGPSGYRTIHTGKWHVGDKKKEWWPLGRGFDRTFGSPAGGGFYFRPSGFRLPRFIVRNDDVIYDMENDPPEGWYTTDAYTDEGLDFVREATEEDKPFFWYCAYNAPHYPLKAKPADIEKYRGRYKVGWDAIRSRRHDRLIELGIIDRKWELSPRPNEIPAWSELTEQQRDEQDLRMATYAAMIDCIDQNVGKVVQELKRIGEYENTLILFLHDNGGCAEGGNLGTNKGKGECGTVDSEAYYGKCWANVSDSPFRKYKSQIHEGGISTPLIAHWPGGIEAAVEGELVTEPGHVIDLMATCVDVAKAEYPRRRNGHAIVPMEGKSLRPAFSGKELGRDQPLFFEHSGNRGVRNGQWKLVALKGGDWELYDVEADRTELHDLAQTRPEKVKQLRSLYDEWAHRCFVNKSPKRSKAGAATKNKSTRKDLVTPVMTNGPPTAGKRVRQVSPEYAGTDVYHSLYLPEDWKPKGKFPVIVEYTGNKFPPGKGSGEVKDANLGYGMSGGKGFIWIVMPYIEKDKQRNAVTWWGDRQATVDYCKVNLPRICDQYGGDRNNVIVCGFSRGAIGTSYIALADDEIAALWKGVFTHDHFDGHRQWGYPESDRDSALRRLARLKGRPVLVGGQNADQIRQSYLNDHLGLAQFTFLQVPTDKIFSIPEGPYLHPHTDLWMHRESDQRKIARQWLQRVVDSD